MVMNFANLSLFCPICSLLQSILDMEKSSAGMCTCGECGCSPCIFRQEYESLMDLCEVNEKMGKNNKEMRFILYKHMSRVLFGYLGRGNRKPLPACVVREIHDHYPKPDNEKYVGFQENREKHK
jgi:hypothetical protein